MIPVEKIKQIVKTYETLEKELASPNLEKKDFVKKSKEYSILGEVIKEAKSYINFEKEKKINRILITTITLSSAEVLQKRFKQNEKIVHQFLPLDIPKFINKFLNHWSPNLSIFIDSEIWPNLIFHIKERNIPLLLVNGRITKKTFLRWKFLKNFKKNI